MKKILLLVSLVLLTTLGFGQGTRSPNPDKEIIRIITSQGYSEKVAKYWVRVARLESGHYTSKLYKSAHNPWGMRFTKKRVTANMTKTKKGWARYQNDSMGYWDIIYYMQHKGFPKDVKNLDEFCKVLKKKKFFQEDYKYYYDTLSRIKDKPIG